MKKDTVRKVISVLLGVILVSIITPINGIAQQNDSTGSSSDLVTYFSVKEYSGFIPELTNRISVDLLNVQRPEALFHIAQKAGLEIAFNSKIFGEEVISITNSNIRVADALELALADTDYESVITSRRELLLKKKEVHPVDLETDSQTTVSGRVVDAETNEPLIGVTVFVEGTQTGTTTDMDGRFTLNIPDDGEVLAFSYVGYIRQEISIGDNTEFDVRLVPDIAMIDEIVVVGYGEQRRSNLTGAISSVSLQDIENRPQLRLDEALQGMAAGVTVTQSGGAPGSAPSIHIRGVGSISNTEPLWIVDGVRMDAGNHLNVNDVESIEILKDAASAAIYGARAAHGVILVTTKRGRGETRFTFNSSVGKRSPLNLPTLLNSEQFVHYKKESRLNAGQNPEPAWDEWEHDTDWIDEYYAGSGMFTSNYLSISQGDDRMNYYISLGYDNETGILIDNTLQRISGRINTDIHLSSAVTIGTNIFLSRVDENPINNFNENRTGAIPYRSIPIMPVRDESNPYGGWGQGPVYFQGPNPVASHYQQHETHKNHRINSNLYVQVNPIEGLSLRGTVGYNMSSFVGENFNEAFNYGAFANTINSLTLTNADNQTIEGNVTLTYGNSIGRHNFQLMGGLEASQYLMEQSNVTGTNFPVDVARSMNLATGEFNTTQRFNVYEARLLSQFGRLNYNFDNRYLIETNIRRDASAPKFGPQNIWGVFPSFSVGWNVSNERFFNVPYISTFRIRASTGKLGSDNIGDYNYLRTYTSQFTSYAFDENGQNRTSGFFISRFPNEEVKWEEINQHNIGIDISAFQGKLTFGIDYYIKDTKDLLYGIPIPTSSGIAVHNFNPVNPEINIGTLRNTGLDVQMGYKTDVSRFFIDLSGNVSFMDNKMLSLADGGYIIGGYGGGQMSGMTRTQPGMPISSFYGFRVRQVLNSDGDVYAINSWSPDGIYQEGGTGPGDFMYWDLSGPDGEPDGKVTWEHDRTFIGNPWPKMTFAMNTRFVFDNMIDVSFQFQGVYGVDIFNADKAYTRNFFGDSNTTPLIGEAWRTDNHTNHPRNIASDPNGNFGRPSDYFVEDGSYLKLRNAQIGFIVPQRYLNMLGASNIRIYVNATNLLTITGYSGLDPEVGGSNLSRGIDYGIYPHVRTITGGIELQF